jgi:hypothetical protein
MRNASVGLLCWTQVSVSVNQTTHPPPPRFHREDGKTSGTRAVYYYLDTCRSYGLGNKNKLICNQKVNNLKHEQKVYTIKYKLSDTHEITGSTWYFTGTTTCAITFNDSLTPLCKLKYATICF